MKHLKLGGDDASREKGTFSMIKKGSSLFTAKSLEACAPSASVSHVYVTILSMMSRTFILCARGRG